jgi:hypothetical protein
MQFVYNEVQTVAPNGSVVFNSPQGCNCNCNRIIHRPGSGICTLRGNGRYSISFKANIATAEGAAAGPIAMALAIDGEPVPVTRVINTPAAAGDYDDVSFSYELYVPCGCCQNVSVENVLPNSDAATVAVPVDVQNAILKIDPMRR